MESFIRSKYESKRWAMEGPPPADPSVLDGGAAAVRFYSPNIVKNEPHLVWIFRRPNLPHNPHKCLLLLYPLPLKQLPELLSSTTFSRHRLLLERLAPQ